MSAALARFLNIFVQRGGLARTLRKAKRVYQREGMGGVGRRALGVFYYLVGSSHSERAYAQWLEEFLPTDVAHLEKLRLNIDHWSYLPLVSVVIPVYNPPLQWLAQAIESVKSQVYPHWELCLADDASTASDVRPFLEGLARNDQRIRVVFRNENGHISAATNSAIELASGRYIGFLDQDDLLSPDALFWIVERLQHAPRPLMLFSDEDKVSASGERFNPHFKCEINRELLLSQNMVTHFVVYETDLVRSLGGCRLGFEGSQDYDLTLRAIDVLARDQITHIPRLLYHWRVHADSTAAYAQCKPYALFAAQRAIEEHLQRNGETARVHMIAQEGLCRVEFALPTPPPLVSILIPTRDQMPLVKQCIESLLDKTSYPHFEIILIDNGSSKPEALDYFESLSAHPRIHLLRDDRPFNFSALNNAAAQIAKGEVLVLLNNDTEIIHTDWLCQLVSQAVRPGNGAVGAKLLYPDGRVQHAGVVLGFGDCAGHLHLGIDGKAHGYFSRAVLAQNFSAVTGACLAVRKELYLRVGGLNEIDLTVAFNDVDFCLRLQALGFRNVYTPHSVVIHHESVSRGYENTPAKVDRFEREVAYMQCHWGHLIWNDHCYSPNLSFDNLLCHLAYPPRLPFLPLVSSSPDTLTPLEDVNAPSMLYGLVIPTKNAGQRWTRVLAGLKCQTGMQFKVLIVDSGSDDNTNTLTKLAGFELLEIAPQSFGHGSTRQMALERLACDVVFFLTQDSVLATPHSLFELAQAFQDPKVALAYGRQIAFSDASRAARSLREFNYPVQSEIRSFEDRHRLGIRCAFNSNSFAAYRVNALRQIGGFDVRVPVGEDVIACALLLQAGFRCSYVAHAKVFHSHDYGWAEEFRRYHRIGRMHRQCRQIMQAFGPADREGLRFVKDEFVSVLLMRPWALPATLLRIGLRYIGYRTGLGF